jgi:outer membrane protein OmpA-like peptidoglycan-associated protein
VVVRLRALPDAMSSREVQDVVDGVRGARSITVRIPRRPGLRAASPSARAEPTPDPTPAPAAAEPASCASPQEQVDALLGPDKVAFGNDGAVLPESQRAEVEAVAAYVVRCQVAVNAVGHTADRAPARSRIGVERARAVAEVLREAGALVVRVQGKRGSQPLGDNDTQAGRLLNRYADVVVR